MTTLTQIDIDLLETMKQNSVSHAIKTQWNLPPFISANCDIYCLRKWDGQEIAERLAESGDLSDSLELYGFKFSPVWTTTAKKFLANPLFFKMSFWLSFRSIITDSGRQSYVIIQLDERQKLQ